MHGKQIVERLLGEHSGLREQLLQWEAALQQAAGGPYGQCQHALSVLRELCRVMERVLSHHLQEEEQVLYTFVKWRLPRLRELIEELRGEHDALRAAFAQFRQALAYFNKSGELAELEQLGWDLLHRLRRHMEREERELHPVVLQEFKEEDWRELSHLHVDSEVA